jgi:hypothetical protein
MVGLFDVLHLMFWEKASRMERCVEAWNREV